MMTPRIRRQLAAFAVISVAAVTLTVSVYARLPQQLGIGQYAVVADFADASGLYPQALVSYRGLDVGRVSAVDLRPDGVSVHLSLDRETAIPADVSARIRSTSAVGEQYVDLEPRTSDTPGALADVGAIPRNHTEGLPQIGPLLDSLDRLVTSVPHAPLQRLLDDVPTALDGTHGDVARLLNASSSLLDQATEESTPTKQLIRNAAPVLLTQVDLAPRTTSAFTDLASLTSQIRDRDSDIAHLLKVVPRAAAQIEDLNDLLAPVLPGLLGGLSAILRTIGHYLPGLQQVLVVYPALVSDLIADVAPLSDRGAVPLDFRLNLNDPPACTKGFLPVTDRRDPSLTDLIPTPRGLYCQLPKDAVETVRGARNLPCEGGSTRREATPELCRGED